MTTQRIATKTTSRTTLAGTKQYQGMNWITQSKRLSIYLRDNLACCYCGTGIEDGVTLSLDRLKPHSKGGNNHETNLVTCCKFCNDSRGNRGVSEVARGVAAYRNHGVTAEAIIWHVAKQARRSLKPFTAQAKEMIAERGSVAKALANGARRVVATE